LKPGPQTKSAVHKRAGSDSDKGNVNYSSSGSSSFEIDVKPSHHQIIVNDVKKDEDEDEENENEVRDNEEHIDFFDFFASPVQETDEWGNIATHVTTPYQQDDNSSNNEEE
jgi:hypothetical protein